MFQTFNNHMANSKTYIFFILLSMFFISFHHVLTHELLEGFQWEDTLPDAPPNYYTYHLPVAKSDLNNNEDGIKTQKKMNNEDGNGTLKKRNYEDGVETSKKINYMDESQTQEKKNYKKDKTTIAMKMRNYDGGIEAPKKRNYENGILKRRN